MLPLVLACVLALTGSVALADDRDTERAAKEARDRSGGQVLRVTPDNGNNGGGYRAKVLTPDGKIRTLRVGGEGNRDKN